MILLDAIYINKSGGKVLLDYLIQTIESKSIPCYYLLDARLEGQYLSLPKDRKSYLPGSLIKRHGFYKNNQHKFTSVLCFGNLPPSVRCDGTVYTYFHQPLYLKIPESVGLRMRLTLKLKMLVLKTLRRYTDFFLVQSPMIQSALQKKYRLSQDSVVIVPFFPKLPEATDSIEKVKHSFIYVSSGAAHKNHDRLLEAFEKFYSKYGKGKLILTVPEQFNSLYEKIKGMQGNGLPITNIGYVSHEQLSNEYAKTEHLIFPSLAESFGLGLIEAIQFNCMVIGADLDYTYQVCEPSLVFDPLDTKSIFQALEQTLSEDIPDTKPLISDEINSLLSVLQTPMDA
jgi:glycosyltransferase involved in cell wall biosynthesis